MRAKKKSYLASAINALCTHHDITQRRFAELVGLPVSTINQIVNQYRRPQIEVLRAICLGYGDRADLAKLVMCHIEDEIERAGHRVSEYSISHGEVTPEDIRRTLEDIKKADEDLYTHLINLIRCIASDVVSGTVAMVAEKVPTWQDGKK